MTSASRTYVVQYDPKALKEPTKLDKPVARRIVKAIDALNADPRPSGARTLVGYPDQPTTGERRDRGMPALMRDRHYPAQHPPTAVPAHRRRGDQGGQHDHGRGRSRLRVDQPQPQILDVHVTGQYLSSTILATRRRYQPDVPRCSAP